MTEDHFRPRPWRSLLLPHLDEIRAMRRARRTWREIADHLRATHGIKIAPSNVYRFFKRAAQRKKLPLGFEDEPATGTKGFLHIVQGRRYQQEAYDAFESVSHILLPSDQTEAAVA